MKSLAATAVLFLAATVSTASIDRLIVVYQPFPDPQGEEIHIMPVPVFTRYYPAYVNFSAICAPNPLVRIPPDLTDTPNLNLAAACGISVKLFDQSSRAVTVELDLRDLHKPEDFLYDADPDAVVEAVVNCVQVTAEEWYDTLLLKVECRDGEQRRKWQHLEKTYDVRGARDRLIYSTSGNSLGHCKRNTAGQRPLSDKTKDQ